MERIFFFFLLSPGATFSRLRLDQVNVSRPLHCALMRSARGPGHFCFAQLVLTDPEWGTYDWLVVLSWLRFVLGGECRAGRGCSGGLAYVGTSRWRIHKLFHGYKMRDSMRAQLPLLPSFLRLLLWSPLSLALGFISPVALLPWLSWRMATALYMRRVALRSFWRSRRWHPCRGSPCALLTFRLAQADGQWRAFVLISRVWQQSQIIYFRESRERSVFGKQQVWCFFYGTAVGAGSWTGGVR